MGRKPVLEGGKRDEIIDAATKLFFEKGFEGTSIRMIQREVGSEIGLFYYYFKSKDEVYNIVMDRFLKKYDVQYRNAIDSNEDVKFILLNFFKTVQHAVKGFQENCASNVHWSIRRAIRESSLERMCPYIRECLDILENNGYPITSIPLDKLAVVLSYGIGGIIVQRGEELSDRDMMNTINLLLGSHMND